MGLSINGGYTAIVKKHVRKLNKRYRCIKNDLEPVIKALKAGLLVGDRFLEAEPTEEDYTRQYTPMAYNEPL